MRNIVYFDASFPVTGLRYSAELTTQAQSRLMARKLRFDNRTGIVRDNTGILVKYCNQSDFAPHETVDQVYQWEFTKEINNEAWHILVDRIGVDAALIVSRQ